MTPEAKARATIDALLQQAGWHVCDMGQANIHAARGVAIREFPLNPGYGFADYLLYIDGKAAGVIEAKKEGESYTSTRITTQNKKAFQYGRIETRAKLPVGTGLWPAFWMLGQNISTVGWPKCGEIDILEYVGKQPDIVFTSLHTQASHGNTINTKKTTIPTIEEGFHNYAIDWTKDKIAFFVDDVLVYTFQPEVKDENTWPYNQPFYFIINVAIGGNFGGPTIDHTILPQEFIVDYIKVYQ